METPQGSTATPEPNPQGGSAQQPEPTTGVPKGLEQYVAEPANSAPTAPQGVAQAEPQPQTTGTPQFDPAKHFQSIAEQRLADNYRLQQRLAELESQVKQGQPNSEPRNPYDPQTQPEQWWDFKINSAVERAAMKGSELSTQRLLAVAQEQSRIAQESQWQAQHPGVDINYVKAWGNMNGVTNLDHAYTLMNLPNQMVAAQLQATQQTMQAFTRPQQGAVPMRPSAQGSAPGQVALEYAKLAQDYVATNGEAYKTWPPQVQQIFDHETNMREAARQAGRKG